MATTKALIEDQRSKPVYCNSVQDPLGMSFTGNASRSDLNDEVQLNHCFQLVLNESLQSNQIPTVGDLIHLLKTTHGITEDEVISNYHKTQAF